MSEEQANQSIAQCYHAGLSALKRLGGAAKLELERGFSDGERMSPYRRGWDLNSRSVRQGLRAAMAVREASEALAMLIRHVGAVRVARDGVVTDAAGLVMSPGDMAQRLAMGADMRREVALAFWSALAESLADDPVRVPGLLVDADRGEAVVTLA